MEFGKQEVSPIQDQEVCSPFSFLLDEGRPSGKTARSRFSSAVGLDVAIEIIAVNEG
jgi:hypothetical protein